MKDGLPKQVVGATLLLQIVIPGLGLGGKALKHPLPDNLITLDRPNDEQVLYVSVIESCHGIITFGPTMANAPTRTLGQWPTEEGGVVWIVSHLAELSNNNRAFILNKHNQVRTWMRGVDSKLTHDATDDAPSELRSLVMPPPSDGIAQIIDLSLEFLRTEFPSLQTITEANIRTRAYFLWQNRTGRTWEDPESNWLEAEATEHHTTTL